MHFSALHDFDQIPRCLLAILRQSLTFFLAVTLSEKEVAP